MLIKENERVKHLVEVVKSMGDKQRNSDHYKKYAFATRGDIIRAFK